MKGYHFFLLAVVMSSTWMIAQDTPEKALANHRVIVTIPALHGDRVVDYIMYLQKFFTILAFDADAFGGQSIAAEQAMLVAHELWNIRRYYEQHGAASSGTVKEGIETIVSQLPQKAALFKDQDFLRRSREINQVFHELIALVRSRMEGNR
ncbi:hypothetical protein KJZ61_01415 [Candidatus Dependentiae bacterium]|nr:hypothetical protein [Candidatus Dependentiae bacterium]